MVWWEATTLLRPRYRRQTPACALVGILKGAPKSRRSDLHPDMNSDSNQGGRPLIELERACKPGRADIPLHKMTCLEDLFASWPESLIPESRIVTNSELLQLRFQKRQ